MNDKIRIGMIGGSTGSFMGDIHRQAIAQSGCAEVVCGAFGSTRQSSFDTGKALGLPTPRVYGTYRDLFRRETTLPPAERIQMITVVTPNAMHYPIAMSAIDAGFPILCEKPFTCNLDEAVNLCRKQRANAVPYGIAMAYDGYPMILKARELILDQKALGTVRKVNVSFTLGWLAQRLETAGNKQAAWRADPRRCGNAGCLTDLGTHGFFLAEHLTGLTVSELCADSRATVAGRILDDDCDILIRFASGARGLISVTQIATGQRDGIAFDIYGDKAALHWRQSDAGKLRLADPDGNIQIFDDGLGLTSAPPPYPPTPYGGDPAYVAALANVYRAFITQITTKPKSKNPVGFASINNGLRNIAFLDAAIKSITPPPPDDTAAAPKWTPLIVPPVNDL